MDYDSIGALKDIMNSTRWHAQIRPSSLSLRDLSAFAPMLATMNDPVKISGNISGKISSFRLQDFDLKYRNSLVLNANVDLNGIPDFQEAFIYADIKDFGINKGEAQDLIAKLTKKPFVLPNELSRLGTVR